MKRTLCALIVLLLLPFATTHAAVTISVSENGADVVATTSGTLNLDGLGTGFANTVFDGFVVGLNDASIISTGVNPGVLTRYLIPVTPLPFMVAGSPFVESDLSSGTMVEIRTYIGDVTYVSLPEVYQSGNSIDSTSTWQGTTIAGLGLVPGTYVFDWDTGENADSLTLNIAVSPPATYSVGGNVSGLTGSVTLQNNGGDDIIKTTNDGFTFPAQADNSAYAVTVSSQPTGQTCSVTGGDNNLGSGTISGADVTNVAVTCVTDVVPTYSVGGTVSGLTGTGLALQNNDGDTLAVAVDGSFTFLTELTETSSYAVTVSTQPTGQTCSVTNDSGTIADEDVTDVGVACVDDVVPPIDPPAPATPVPTMSQWALVMLAMLLGLMAFSKRKRLF